MSLAECPVASMTARDSYFVPSESVTPFTAPFASGYPFTDIFHDTRQFVSTYMRAGVGYYFLRSSVLYQTAEYAVDIAAFFRTRVQFPVRIRTGASFAEAIVGVGIYRMVHAYRPEVAAAFPHIPAPFEPYGTVTVFDCFKRSEHSRRTGTDDDYLFFAADIGIFRRRCFFREIASRKNHCGHLYRYVPPSRIYRTAEHLYGIYSAVFHTCRPCRRVFDSTGIGCVFRAESQLYFCYHNRMLSIGILC